MTEFLADNLIVIPMSEEWRSARSVYENTSAKVKVLERQQRTANYYLWRWQSEFDRSIVATPVWMRTPGESRAAVHVASALSEWRPNRVTLLGIAGSIEPDEIRLGDIVIPSEIFGYEVSAVDDSAKGWKESLRATPHKPSLASLVGVQALRNSEDYERWQEECYTAGVELELPLNGRRPSLHDGCAFGSGNRVVRSEAFAKLLKEKISNRIGAVAMEEVGVDYSIEYSPLLPEFLVIRGISDYADKHKSALEEASKDRWRKFAAGNAARFLRWLVQRDQAAPSAQPYSLDLIAAPPDVTSRFFGEDYRVAVGACHVYFERLLDRASPTPKFKLALTVDAATGADVIVRACLETEAGMRFVQSTIERDQIVLSIPRQLGPLKLHVGIGSLCEVSGVSIMLSDEFGREQQYRYLV